MVSFDGSAIFAQGTEIGDLRDLTIINNRMLTGETAIDIRGGERITIERNNILLADREGTAAIQLQAEDALIKGNDIIVVPAGAKPPDDKVPPPDGGTPDPADPCADFTVFYFNPGYLTGYTTFFWATNFTITPATPSFQALGGIEVEAGSERVMILKNRIQGGAGNGVTLGSPITLDDLKNLITSGRGEGDVGDASEGHVLEHPGDRLVAEVSDGGEPVPDLVVTLTEERTGFSKTAITDEDGRFVLPDAQKGTYHLALGSGGYRVVAIDFDNERWLHLIDVERIGDAQPPVENKLAFLYDIAIERNTITSMGLSGIGVPRAAPKDGGDGDGDGPVLRLRAAAGGLGTFAALLGSYVIRLRIDDNRITGCLQNPFNNELRAVARFIGLGGISLGLCENLLIRWNLVKGNGRSHIDPVCGVFVFAEDADVTHNRVIGNGGPADIRTQT